MRPALNQHAKPAIFSNLNLLLLYISPSDLETVKCTHNYFVVTWIKSRATVRGALAGWIYVCMLEVSLNI